MKTISIVCRVPTPPSQDSQERKLAVASLARPMPSVRAFRFVQQHLRGPSGLDARSPTQTNTAAGAISKQQTSLAKVNYIIRITELKTLTVPVQCSLVL